MEIFNFAVTGKIFDRFLAEFKQSVLNRPMFSFEMKPQLAAYEFENFDLMTLTIDSEVLRPNPLGDPTRRHCPVLVPKGASPESGWPVVLMLSGFTSNGPQAFNIKSYQTPTPVSLDQAVTRAQAPKALFVFCDATTLWGGSQFIDSAGCGRYGTYVSNEVHHAVLHAPGLNASKSSEQWCVMGGSSGGYGALQLASRCPDKFGFAIALAPDSFFEASLLPEIRTALPVLRRMGGVNGALAELKNGKLMKRKDWHVVVNVIAMGLCYAPINEGEPVWPIDLETGKVLNEVWKEWSRHDPLEFLRARISQTQKVKSFYLDAGDRDQFQLQYGTRQIRDLLAQSGATVQYVGFEGTHFDLGERREPAWAWLNSQWCG